MLPPTSSTLPSWLAKCLHPAAHSARDCAGQQVAGHHFELRAGKRDIQVVRAILAHCNKGQVQLCRRRGRKLLLCLFGFLFQPAHSCRVAGEVDADFFELGHSIFHDALIEVVTAQMGVAAGGKHRKGPVLDLDDGTSNVPPPRS